MIRILFVCMGNICRSPTARGVFSRLVQERGLADLISVDSAGTHDYHIGAAPDPRALEAARRRGVDLSQQRARQVAQADFQAFDYVLAMDRDNLAMLRAWCPPDALHKVRLFLDFAPEAGVTDVPDPYYGGRGGFDRVLDLVEAASLGLLEEVLQRLGRSPRP